MSAYIHQHIIIHIRVKPATL